uniref:Potassium calcium-activated channel subfamily M regulatory beta subunit 3 n=1 Tax=Pygocentrus nattereri TaxID=42514 RepID=A0AAR2JT81_PYGNA
VSNTYKKTIAGEKAKAQAPVSSVGEERALLLGFTMVAFSILMYFVVGIVIQPDQILIDQKATDCSVIQAELLNDSDDWRCLSSNPCLQVFVNITASGRRALLHFDEVSVNLSPECFYAPKSQQNKSERIEEAQTIRKYLLNRSGEAISCHPSMGRHSEEAIVKRRYTLRLALQCLLWPSLMLFGGGLLVGLTWKHTILPKVFARLPSHAYELSDIPFLIHRV